MGKLLQQELAKLRKAGHSGLGLYWALGLRLLQLGSYFLRASYCFRRADELGRLVFARGCPVVHNSGYMSIGNGSRIWSDISATQLLTGPDGRLVIGKGCYINGAMLSASESVSLGDNCYLGPMAMVADCDFPSRLDRASFRKSAAVVIGEGAWLATRCMVLKGVTIGQGAVIAVGTVVTGDVPPYCVVAGVPARIVKRLRPAETEAKADQAAEPFPQACTSEAAAVLRQATALNLPPIPWPYALSAWWNRHRLRRLGQCGPGLWVQGRLSLECRGQLEIGARLHLSAAIARCRIAVKEGALLKIGDDCQIEGSIIAATQQIELGNNCRIAPFCHLMDGDFHGLQDRQAAGASGPIILEDGVSLGARVMVLKGVRIGQGAVVAPGSLVTKDVAPFSLVAGVPARWVRDLSNEVI